MSEPAAGPYYFVSDNVPGPDQFYWGGTSRYGGVRVVENYNLLATMLGDDPSSLVSQGQTLVDPASFDLGSETVLVQPFVFTQGGGNKKNSLPIGPRLNAFLRYPLGDDSSFDLTLPFSDSRVALSDRSALLRTTSGARAWHTAVDFDVSGASSQGFDIVAPADGTVEGNAGTHTLCLRHRASNGTDFLTIYAHMVPESKSQLTNGVRVLRGDNIGRVQGDGYTHLHFGVAVSARGGQIQGTEVPRLWYLIDPFGVYDYRRSRGSQSAYNYLLNNTLEKPARGVHKAYVWRTNPPIGSLLVREDCLPIDPDGLSIEALDNGAYRINSGSHNLMTFPNMLEAGNALSVLKKYRYTQICYIGRPNASMQYFK